MELTRNERAALNMATLNARSMTEAALRNWLTSAYRGIREVAKMELQRRAR